MSSGKEGEKVYEWKEMQVLELEGEWFRVRRRMV